MRSSEPSICKMPTASFKHFGKNEIQCKSRMYNLCLNPPRCKWFGFRDMASRFLLSIVLFYYLLLTRPIYFIRFTKHFNQLYYGYVPGMLLTSVLPILPWVLCLVEVGNRLYSDSLNKWWSNDAPSKIFFDKPKGIINSLLWDFWLNISLYATTYLLAGDDKIGIDQSWYDCILKKNYWHDLFESCNTCMPRKLFHWKDRELRVHYDLHGRKVICKLNDSCLGIGDNIWTQGVEFTDEKSLKELLEKEYGHSEAIASEFVSSGGHLGVHIGDILTIRASKEDPAHIMHVLYWGDCKDETSHSATSIYHVDANTETITSPAQWYCPAILDQSTNMVGTKLPGTQSACVKALEMHNSIKLPWCSAIGWDYMYLDNGECVFFEGNYATSRVCRHIFNSFSVLVEICQIMAPMPFTSGYSQSTK